MNEHSGHKKSTLSEAEIMCLEHLEKTLNSAHIHYTIFAQDLIIRSAQEGVDQGLGELVNMAPTFILWSDLGYRAAVIRGDTRLSYKKIRRELQIKNLCLASPEEVQQVTGAEVGYVSLINSGITTIVDRRLMEIDTIFGGCGVPRYTLKISPCDLIAVTQANVFDFAESKES